jgi:hypothetical protein
VCLHQDGPSEGCIYTSRCMLMDGQWPWSICPVTSEMSVAANLISFRKLAKLGKGWCPCQCRTWLPFKTYYQIYRTETRTRVRAYMDPPHARSLAVMDQELDLDTLQHRGQAWIKTWSTLDSVERDLRGCDIFCWSKHLRLARDSISWKNWSGPMWERSSSEDHGRSIVSLDGH